MALALAENLKLRDYLRARLSHKKLLKREYKDIILFHNEEEKHLFFAMQSACLRPSVCLSPCWSTELSYQHLVNADGIYISPQPPRHMTLSLIQLKNLEQHYAMLPFLYDGTMETFKRYLSDKLSPIALILRQIH